MRAAKIVAIFFFAVALSACAVILGLDPLDVYVEGEAGAIDDDGGLDGGAPGEAGSLGEVGKAACDPDAGPPLPAVYVSRTFDAGSATPMGTATDPVASIAAALPWAKVSNATTIVVEEGTYTEAVTIENMPKDVTIQGAFVRDGGTWTRDCSPDRVAKTILKSTSNVGLRVVDNTGVIGVSDMTIEAGPTPPASGGAPGNSSYGVYVERSLLRLTSVHVKASPGGPGGQGVTGAAGAPLCSSTLACVATPTNGTNGPPGAPATTFGTFGPNGFVPGDGAPGPQKGTNGSNGTPGGDPLTMPDCSTGCDKMDRCTAYPPEMKTGNRGQCGCGGSGGEPGGPGRGGGASIAVYATGQGTLVTVAFSELTATNGGNGSPGGEGGPGGMPTPGAPGAPVDCYVVQCCEIGTCLPGSGCGCYFHNNWDPLCGNGPPQNRPLSGGPGGAGRPGGKGSNGGGGAGGPSFTYVPVNGAQIAVEAASCKRTFGTGGVGAGGAPGGPTGEKP